MAYSVAMCTYNGEKYIRFQLDSILNQTFPPNEIVVCDDGSTDQTQQILEEYKQKYPEIFRIYVNEENLKSVKNFEKAISLSTEEIIFLSDQDDIWVKDKAEKMIHFFDKNPHIEVLATNGFCIDENGKTHEKYAVWDIPQFLREQNIPVNYYEIIIFFTNIATGASMAFRSKIRDYILPFPLIKGYHHDEWIATVSSQRGTFEFLDEKLFYYRTHDAQQVGGVFFEKTEKVKKNLHYFFSHIFYHTNKSFSTYKSALKRIAVSYQKQKIVGKEDILCILKERFTHLKWECQRKYPIRSKILFLIDKISGKRQIHD